MIIISDLDGTLVDVTARQHFVTGPQKDFPAFHEEGCRAEPIHSTMFVLHELLRPKYNHFGSQPRVDSGNELHIVTGRETLWRDGTVAWLTRHSLPYVSLHMRPTGDRRPDIEYKYDVARYYERSEVVVVLEDRDRVVKMWRDLGFTCWQVAHGAY